MMFVLHKSTTCERFNKILNNTCNRKQSQNDCKFLNIALYSLSLAFQAGAMISPFRYSFGQNNLQ